MSPGKSDERTVERHLLALDQAVRILRRSQGKALEVLEVDEERWTVERGLHLCAQNALDIATHLAASHGRDVPDYASAIDKLGEIGILPKDFSKRFRTIAGFRNVLVHGYLDVDLRVLHEVLNRHLDDFETFAKYISATMEPSS